MTPNLEVYFILYPEWIINESYLSGLSKSEAEFFRNIPKYALIKEITDKCQDIALVDNASGFWQSVGKINGDYVVVLLPVGADITRVSNVINQFKQGVYGEVQVEGLYFSPHQAELIVEIRRRKDGTMYNYKTESGAIRVVELLEFERDFEGKVFVYRFTNQKKLREYIRNGQLTDFMVCEAVNNADDDVSSCHVVSWKDWRNPFDGLTPTIEIKKGNSVFRGIWLPDKTYHEVEWLEIKTEVS